MDDISTISSGLWRPVAQSSRFDKLMKGTKCSVSPLKSGDTFVTVELMREWVKRHLAHTADLAPQLKGRNLKETADKIYGFLYNHIQYLADGAMQNLKSPGCAWATRHEGADCKTFSIFASSILTNLNIQHSIRQVSQPGFHPEQFTHVYVVIPENQKIKTLRNEKIFVIDATKHENTEVNYLEKKDMLQLQHQGLSAPRSTKKPSKALCSTSGRILGTSKSKAMRKSAGRKLSSCRGLNAAVNGTPIGAKMKGNPAEKVVTGLNQFVNYLVYLGIPASKAQQVQDLAVEYLKKGIDPVFMVTREGILVGQNLVKIADHHGLASPGLSLAPALIPLITGALAGSGGKGEEPTGANIGGIFNGILGENGGLFGGTLGAVFANGFNLSCWNASMTPSRVEQEFKPELQAWMIKQTDAIKNQNNPALLSSKLTEISKKLNAFKTHAQFHQSEVKASCSKEANSIKVALVVETLKEFDKIIEQLKQYYTVKAVNKSFDANTVKEGKDLAADWKGRKHPSTYKEYTLSAKSGSGGGFVNVGGGYSGGNVPTNNYTGGQAQGQTSGVQKAGFPILPALLVGGAGVGLYMNSKKKKGAK